MHIISHWCCAVDEHCRCLEILVRAFWHRAYMHHLFASVSAKLVGPTPSVQLELALFHVRRQCFVWSRTREGFICIQVVGEDYFTEIMDVYSNDRGKIYSITVVLRFCVGTPYSISAYRLKTCLRRPLLLFSLLARILILPGFALGRPSPADYVLFCTSWPCQKLQTCWNNT